MRSSLVSFGSRRRPQAEDIKRVALERPPPLGFGGGRDNTGSGSGGGAGLGRAWSSSTTRREASVVLVDRTLDLAAAASHGGSLLQRVR